MYTHTVKVEKQLKKVIPTSSDNHRLSQIEEILSEIRDKSIDDKYLEDFFDDFHTIVKKLMWNHRNPQSVF